MPMFVGLALHYMTQFSLRTCTVPEIQALPAQSSFHPASADQPHWSHAD